MELYGLVLTGGKSERMERDKALLRYHRVPHARFLFDLLARHCTETFLSARRGQWADTELEGVPTLADLVEDLGPIGGILSAFQRRENASWFVLACDFPRFQPSTAAKLIRHFDPGSAATYYVSGGQPEPLCAIYTPAARAALEAAAGDGRGPIHALRSLPCRIVAPDTEAELWNANTPEEARLSAYGAPAPKSLAWTPEEP